MSEEYVARALDAYDLSRLTLCSIGSHSALDVASGARAQGLRNLIVTAKGREKTYSRYFVREESPVGRGCVDGVLELQDFPEILNEDVQRRLFEQNVIFVANRSFEVYLHQQFGYDEIERRMLVPFFGNRHLLRAEERTLPFDPAQGKLAQGDKGEDQYALMRAAGIRHPRRFASPDDIDRLVMVKAPHARVSFERAFFLASSPEEYRATADHLMDEGILSAGGLASARIEEYVLGPSVNLNFFYSPILGELELSGTDTRRQTNLEGFRSVPPSAFEAVRGITMRLEEVGHIATTRRGVNAGAGLRNGRAFRPGCARGAAPRSHRAVRAAMHRCRRTSEGARLLRRFVTRAGLAGDAIHPIFGVSLGPRRLGRRADCDGSRNGPRHQTTPRRVDLNSFAFMEIVHDH